MKVVWRDVRRNVRYITNAAFADLPCAAKNESYIPTFTVEPDDKGPLLSMEKLYMSYYKDPTEYSFVRDVFDGDIKHWEFFKNSAGIKELYDRWRSAACAKLASEATEKIVNIAFDDNNRNQFTALKYLVEKDNKPTTRNSVGRPKKEPKAPDFSSRDIMEDIARLKA